VGTTREAAWLVAGLGNPGADYRGTRHNVGFMVADRLAGAAFRPARHQVEAAWVRLGDVSVALVKPQAFMNLSGPPVADWLAALSLTPDRLVVVHDDLDLPLGRLRVSAQAGAGGHRGVASIQASLGTKAFARVRVGIGRPPESAEAVDHVLEVFSPGEMPVLSRALEDAAEAVQVLIRHGLARAMNRYNRRRDQEEDSREDSRPAPVAEAREPGA
jgi:PTH1 family peptidyl-tRNA hydrolase